MTKIKDYYPSLLIGEYELGHFYMFIRNVEIDEKKISDKQKEYIVKEKGGFILDCGKSGFILDENKITKGKSGFILDNGSETDDGVGGFKKDDGRIVPDERLFEEYDSATKRYAQFSYEAGRIIGVNEEDGKIYVQFKDTKEGYCHIFKTGVSSGQFDLIDKMIQNSGK